MGIKVLQDSDVAVTESELRRYQGEYRDAYLFYSGVPPTLEEFIRRRQSQPFADLWLESTGKGDGK